MMLKKRPGTEMLGRLNHVAIAVKDISSATRTYRDIFGAKVSEPLDQPIHGVTVVFITLSNTKIESFNLGDSIKGFFICDKKINKNTRFGDPYIDLLIKDSSGIIRCKIWNNVDFYNFTTRKLQGPVTFHLSFDKHRLIY